MVRKRILLVLASLVLASVATGQINIYLGGNLQGNYSWIRGDEATFNPGFGGGFSFVYWEYEYWFIKAGADYHYKTSSCLHYPDDFGVTPVEPDDKIEIGITEQSVGVPLTLYYRPFESGENTMLLVGSLETMFTLHLRENTEEYGEIIRTGSSIKSRTKTNIGIGAGYQRQLDRHLYLNIYPSFHMDIRADRPFNSFKLTLEILYGVY